MVVGALDGILLGDSVGGSRFAVGDRDGKTFVDVAEGVILGVFEVGWAEVLPAVGCNDGSRTGWTIVLGDRVAAEVLGITVGSLERTVGFVVVGMQLGLQLGL